MRRDLNSGNRPRYHLFEAGPLLIGPLVAYLLFGAYVVQLSHFVLNPVPGDGWVIYALVVLVTLVEGVGMVVMTLYTWKALFIGGGPYEVIVHLKWSPTSPLLYGLVALLVQVFFAWKIRTLLIGRSGWVRVFLPCLILVLSIIQLAGSIGTTVLASGSSSSVIWRIFTHSLTGIQFARVNGETVRAGILKPSVVIQRAGSLASDALITGSMIGILLIYKNETHLRATQKLLNGLIINAIENVAVTTVFVGLSLGFYLARPDDFLHIAFQQAVGRLYANVLMASLNGRTVHQWKHRFEEVNSEGDIEAQREAEIAIEDDRMAVAIEMKVLRRDVETFNNHQSSRIPVAIPGQHGLLDHFIAERREGI